MLQWARNAAVRDITNSFSRSNCFAELDRKPYACFFITEGKPIHKSKSIPHICGHKYMHAYTQHIQIHPRTHMYI